MRLRNAHTSAIDGVKPGDVGEFNPDIVRGLIDAGRLVPAEGESAHSAERGPTHAEGLAMLEEIERRGARITELEVEVAQLKLDLEAATAPKGDAEKPAKARKD